MEHMIWLKDGQPEKQQLVEKLLGNCSEWCSPMVIIFKKDGFLRICIDFRKRNAISEYDAYLMPRADDLLEKVSPARFITALKGKGYWQVPLEEASQPYTAFQTPAGLSQFKVMPFGLHRAPATF